MPAGHNRRSSENTFLEQPRGRAARHWKGHDLLSMKKRSKVPKYRQALYWAHFNFQGNSYGNYGRFDLPLKRHKASR